MTAAIDYNAPRSSFERLVDHLSVALLVILFMYTAKSFMAMPDIVPTHFNFQGEVDRWGSRWFVWFLPAVAVFTFVLLVLPGKFPQSMNYPVKITPDNAQRQFLLARVFVKTLKLATLTMFLFIQWFVVQSALQKDTGLNFFIFMLLVLAIIFLPILIYFYLATRAR